MGDARKSQVLTPFTENDFNLNLGKIELGAVLGKGAFSTVYKANYGGKTVAIKKQKLADEDLEKYVMKELSILRRCNHVGLVQYIGSCKVDSDTIYIATEYCSGGDLRWLLQSNQPLGWRLRIKLVLGVAEGLAYLHHRDLIHRDIKTENVLLTSDLKTKLCDFGFARSHERKTEGGRPMTMCGTDEFMAPEIIFGMEYNEKVDVFGFGIVLAELISRKIPGKKANFLERHPMNGFTVDKSELQAMKKDFSPPESLYLLCEECLADDGENRPSAEDCFNWLDDLYQEQPEDTEPLPTVEDIISSRKLEDDGKEKRNTVTSTLEDEEDDDDYSFMFENEVDKKKEALRRKHRITIAAKEALFDQEQLDKLKQRKAPSLIEQQTPAITTSDTKQKAKPKPHSQTPPPTPNLSEDTKFQVMSGYITKRGGRIKTWKRRFMVITKEGLVYFKTREDFYEDATQSMQGSLVFSDMIIPPNGVCVSDTVPFLTTGKQHSFRVMTKARARYFCSNNAKLTEKWVRNINLAYSAWAVDARKKSTKP